MQAITIVPVAIIVFWIAHTAYLIMRSPEINTVQIKLPAGETIIGRSAQYFYFRENSLRWFIKRYPFPFGGSLIVTNRRIIFYYDNFWYDEILMKDLVAIECFGNSELHFRYRQGGVERAMTVMIAWWGSYDPLLQLIAKAGMEVHQMPARRWGTPN